LCCVDLARSDSLLSRTSMHYGDHAKAHGHVETDSHGDGAKMNSPPVIPHERYYSPEELKNVITRKDTGQGITSLLSPDSSNGVSIHSSTKKSQHKKKKLSRKLSKSSPSPSKTFSI
jgi:hypothetical protein